MAMVLIFRILLLNIFFCEHYVTQPLPHTVQVEVIACDGWQYSSISNSLQIQLKGQYDATPFVFINPFTSLPTNGRSQIFDTALNYFDIYGVLFSVLISSDDLYGYCLKGLTIYLNGFNLNNRAFSANITNQTSNAPSLNATLGDYGIYPFYYDHFGDGVIVAKECKYTYRSLSTHRTLIRCFDDYFEIYSRFTINVRIRGIYKTVAHTCMHPNSGITALGMIDNVYAVIMGKIHFQNVYRATRIEYLDHVQVGNVDLDQLGHIVAANVLLTNEYAFYSRNVEGTIIGIKLEAVGFTQQMMFADKDMLSFGVTINGQNTVIHSISVLGFGHYLVAFLANMDRKYVSKSTEIMIFGVFGNSLYLNVFVIFEGFNDKYKLPFVVEEYSYDNEYEKYEDNTNVEAQVIEEESEISIAETQSIESTSTESPVYINEYESAESSEIFERGRHPFLRHQLQDSVSTENAKGERRRLTKKYERKPDIKTFGPHTQSEKEDYKGRHGISWFDANKYCMEKYGTYLSSIHSVDENFLIHGFIGSEDNAWIGFVDFDINSMYSYTYHNGCYMYDHNTNPYQYNCDWKWIDGSFVDYTNWKSGGPTNFKYEDCAFMEGHSRNGGWMDTDCENRDEYLSKYVCLSGQWYPNHKRKWDINVQEFVDEYALISIGNDNVNDALCIDSVSLGIERQVYSTVNWIGGDYIDSSLNALFSAPVCKTEVIAMAPQYDTQIFQIAVGGSVVPDQFCKNEGRIGQSLVECKVDQNYQLGLRTVFRLSSGNEEMENVLWASNSRVTLTTQQTESFETQNELFMDQLFRIQYTEKMDNGTTVFTNTRPLTLIPVIQWFDIERNVDALEDDLDIHFDKQQWERISFGNQGCAGKAYVPAAHALPYELVFNSLVMQISLIVDLKMTLCTDFVNSKAYNQDSLVVYANNIDAQILHQEPMSCYIRWFAAQYLDNPISCAEEQKLSITTQQKYLPLCRKSDSALYDGCQCNLVSNMCWCVDESGDILDGQATQIGYNLTWQEICVNQLKCNNSDIVL